MPSRKYNLLNNKDWLHEQYVVNKIGTRKIAKLADVKTPNSVRQALIRNEIPVRSIRESLDAIKDNDYFDLNNISRQVIEGSLLGDASLIAYNIRSENSYPYFKKKNKYYQHILYIAKNIFTHYKEGIITRELDRRYNLYYHTIRTLSHQELLPLIREWYPEYNNYKKVIPESLKVTPLVLLNWFLDDGHAHLRKRSDYKPHWNHNNRQIKIVMSTESFSRKEQVILSEKIENAFNIKFSVTRCKFGTGWRMELPQTQTKDFYTIIGKSPVKELEYKWR